MLADMPDEFLRETTRDERHFEIVKAMGFESYLSVPITARGSILGSLTLVSTDPDRRYDHDDVPKICVARCGPSMNIGWIADNHGCYTAI